MIKGTKMNINKVILIKLGQEEKEFKKIKDKRLLTIKWRKYKNKEKEEIVV